MRLVQLALVTQLLLREVQKLGTQVMALASYQDVVHQMLPVQLGQK
jgi:hypothetical protein